MSNVFSFTYPVLHNRYCFDRLHCSIRNPLLALFLSVWLAKDPLPWTMIRELCNTLQSLQMLLLNLVDDSQATSLSLHVRCCVAYSLLWFFCYERLIVLHATFVQRCSSTHTHLHTNNYSIISVGEVWMAYRLQAYIINTIDILTFEKGIYKVYNISNCILIKTTFKIHSFLTVLPKLCNITRIN